MFKRLAKFILRREIKDYEDRIAYLKEDRDKDQKDLDTTLIKLNAQMNQTFNYQQQIDDLTKENTILKEYYHLDQEPTEEQQTKIRINLKIHELEMRLLQMSSFTSGIAAMSYNYNAMNAYSYSIECGCKNGKRFK